MQSRARRSASKYFLVMALVLVVSWAVPAPAVAPFQVQSAEKSHLLYPPGAEVWADATGTLPATAGPGTPVSLLHVRALVFRPVGDSLTWSDHTALYTHRGLLAPGQKPSFSAVKVATGEEKTADPDANTEETNVYVPRSGGQFLVLGFFRNQRTQHQLAYAVLLQGSLTITQAVEQGKALATSLARQVKLARLGPPHPPGAVASAPSRAVTGPALQVMLQSIERSVLVSEKVKMIARIVIPQSTRIELWTFRTAAPMPDTEFVQFYADQARKLGWGEPISRDETQPGRPALLFQRPDGGVAMIRAEPTPIAGGTPGVRPSTYLFVLMMEGKINVSSLRTR